MLAPYGAQGPTAGVATADVTDVTDVETLVPLPTAGMTMSTGQVELVVSQGGGGYGDATAFLKGLVEARVEGVAFHAIYETPVPVIAAVNDFCMGLGVGLVGARLRIGRRRNVTALSAASAHSPMAST